MALRRSLSGLVPRLLSQQAAPSFARSYAVTPGPVGACSGIPEEILERKVVIYRPSRSCTQGARAGTTWKLFFGEGDRWENPLMGWTSTADPLSVVQRMSGMMEFESKEAAIRFVEKNGWLYEIQEPHAANPLGSSIIRGVGRSGARVKQYGDNFSVKRKGMPIWPPP